MAVNLAPVNDWSAQQPFIDVMKTARRWIGHKPGQWGGVSFQELKARRLLDDNGWPMSVPGDLGSIGTLILTDLPAGADAYAGRYILRFEGDGIVEVSGAADNLRYGKKSVTFDFIPGPGHMVNIKIQRSDPRGKGDYVRNITVVKERHAAAHARGEVFNPDWLPYLDGFEVLRFMDWMVTNDSTQASWAARPKPDDFSYTRNGVPAEVMIRLANKLDAAPWFTMPHLSEAEYQRRFAELVKARLDAPQKVYVEYSNEVWNWQFEQAHWAEERARARWGQEYKGQDFYGMKTARMAQVWARVFADERDRLVNVIGTQAGWLGLEKAILEAPLWVAEDAANKPPHHYVDAYAVTGYFGFFLGTDKRRDLVKGWLAESRAAAEAEARAQGLTGAARDAFIRDHRFDAATEWAIQELEHATLIDEKVDSLDYVLNTVLPYHAGIARDYGLELIMYEGGTHLVGVGAQVEDDEMTAFFTHLNYSPDMARLYERLIDGWFALGAGPFNIFVDVMTPSKWGSWGHLRHLGDDNPRWRVVEGYR